MITSLESRHLGRIVLDGGSGGGAMDGSVSYLGAPLPVRIEIDYPDAFNEAILEDVDMVLDSLDFVHGLAMDTITSGLNRDTSSASQLFRSWKSDVGSGNDDTNEFLRELRPSKILIMPDGGRANPDRVVMLYGLKGSERLGRIKVRFLQPTGPELAHSLQRGP
ncbi:MAG: hypothetical protein ACTIJ6_00590 [Leucobacter sp.]